MSNDRKVVVNTSRRKGELFKISEYDGTYYVYDVDVGLLGKTMKKIGQTRTLKDAIEIIKAFVDGEVWNVEINDW